MKTTMKSVLRGPTLRWARWLALAGAWLEAWPVLPQHEHGGWYV